MEVALAYSGRSRLVETPRADTLSFSPNLLREPVAFDAALRCPLRFREAISSLHDVVVSNLKRAPKDRTAWREWKAAEAERQRLVRRHLFEEARAEILARRGVAVSPDLERAYRGARDRYWSARRRYGDFLMRHDRDLWRKLMPCDPVITVADDVVFFECFSADESSYGCLTVDRAETFGPCDSTRFGTTNVDYSWDLYRHFQSLRTYRETRFRVDPQGFEVATQGAADYREEKIDLPPGWLRGFLQIQAAMCLPMRKVTLTREAVYSLLAWLKRHQAKTSPRAVRFELVAGRPPSLVLEPWERRITSFGPVYDGPPGEPVRVWGRNRLLVLARTLPLIERVDVYLLGTGFPSFWVARMGEMRLTLGLSGWTANDWTRGSAMDLLAPPGRVGNQLVNRLMDVLRERRTATLERLQAETLSDSADCAAALDDLAHKGQLIYDLEAARYRWRQVLPRLLGEAEVGPENEELAASRTIVDHRLVRIESRTAAPSGGTIFTGNAEGKPVEMLIDADNRIRRGRCVCSHHFKGGLRMGPCRHLLALRAAVLRGDGVSEASAGDWLTRLRKWAGN